MAGGEKKWEGWEKSPWKKEESVEGGSETVITENGVYWYQYIKLMQIKVAWDLFKNLSPHIV